MQELEGKTQHHITIQEMVVYFSVVFPAKPFKKRVILHHGLYLVWLSFNVHILTENT